MLLSREAQATGAYAAFATHDERLVWVIADRAREFGLAPGRHGFQTRCGIRPKRQRTLLDLCVRLRGLVPFGEDRRG
jgi:proline dehydrogenase